MRRWLIAALMVALTACTSPSPGSDAPPSRTLPSPTPPSATVVPPQPTTPGGTIAPCPRDETTRLTALTLNLHAARTRGGELDLERIATELEAWGADLVMLQEVDRRRARSGFRDQARVLGRRLGLDWAYGPARRVDPGATGNAVLSRFPLLRTHTRRLPRLPGLIGRGLLRATIDVDGREIDVLSTHFDHLRLAARKAQARTVAAVVRRLGRPVLLGGDLNSLPGKPPLAVLERAGLVDPWPLIGAGDGATVPAAAPRRRIDYLLADDSFVPLRSEVLISLVSDHRAVRTTFGVLPADC